MLGDDDVAAYRAAGYWDDTTIAATVAAHARRAPEAVAFVAGDERLTWREYDERSSALAVALAARFPPGARVGVLLPDGPLVHVVFVALEKAGITIAGAGPRAGDREVEHLLTKASAVALVTTSERADVARRLGIPVVDAPTALGAPPADRRVLAGRASRATDLFLVNSTSGTTGLPKVVMHSQARWCFFHRLAVAAADLGRDDVFMSVIPSPFGFGLWTAHFTPALLGAPCVLMERFTSAGCLAAIERERVTVLACVSTQFVMMLNAPELAATDLSSLRAMFTGGEMVPYERARELEERAGCAVLQFYGSNETGALSGTTLRDDRERRLRTAGRVIPEMRVRLLADDGRDVTTSGGPGVGACRGPTNCFGYLDDDEANAALFTSDGWMLTGDVCTIDRDGYLTVAGRASDFIIRGGKNVSAAAVEDEVGTCPGVAMVAAVAAPDDVFGERVCVYVEERPGATVTLEAIRDHLAARGVGKELWPEHLVVVDALPRSSGGKVAKGALRADIRERLGTDASSG